MQNFSRVVDVEWKRISLVFVCEMSDRERAILYLIKEWVVDEKRIVKEMDIDVRLGQVMGNVFLCLICLEIIIISSIRIFV